MEKDDLHLPQKVRNGFLGPPLGPPFWVLSHSRKGSTSGVFKIKSFIRYELDISKQLMTNSQEWTITEVTEDER